MHDWLRAILDEDTKEKQMQDPFEQGMTLYVARAKSVSMKWQRYKVAVLGRVGISDFVMARGSH